MTILCSLIASVIMIPQASTPATPPAPIVQGGNMLMLTSNLDRSVEFYRDFMGLQDINTTIKGVRAAGMPIVNWSGEPTIQIAFWFFMGREPNNFFFQMQQPAQIPARPPQ